MKKGNKILPKRQVISTSKNRRRLRDGSLAKTEMVVYREPVGKGKYSSRTAHEVVR